MSIEPENDKDVLGKTFKDLQGFVHDKLNKSFKDADDAKNRLDKSDHENQSLRDQLKRAESKLEKRDEKVKNEKNKVLFVCGFFFYKDVCAILTHYHIMPHFDVLKIYSYGKHCEKRRNCL